MGPYIYHVHTEEDVRGIEVCYVFAESIVFK